MTRIAFAAAFTATLLSLSTTIAASCLACPDGDTVGGLDYWTCSDTTITCYYTTSESGVYDACVFTGTLTAGGYYEFDQTGGPSACDGLVIGDNSKCEPSNDPWDVPGDECTSSYAYVGL